ncbi:unnamed protein product [Owenia fusiformis]|uniref:Uncharacterized protein n=1 Tax=Owenia fusiformis TaxID=6347 RepID=A0A8J1XJ62_OWEFU|nr:unnamed protein product [Owenia fusiformis]
MARIDSADKYTNGLALLMCKFCQDYYHNPKILEPCRHTFCLKCIQSVINHQSYRDVMEYKIFCPACRYTCTVPFGGAAGLQSNRFIKALSDFWTDRLTVENFSIKHNDYKEELEFRKVTLTNKAKDEDDYNFDIKHDLTKAEKMDFVSEQNKNCKMPGICVDDLGNTIVAEYKNHRVALYAPDGTFIRYILTEESGLKNPTALCVDTRKNLIVGTGDGQLIVAKYRSDALPRMPGEEDY